MLKNTKKNDYSLISKKELEKLLNEGLNFTEIGSLYGRNLHYIRTICKKYNLKIKSKASICLNCQKKFKHKATIPAKYCSTKCRSAHWPKINKEKHKELVKKSRFKCHPVKCRKCKNNISDNNRKSGLVYCSDLCRKQNKTISDKESRDKKYKQFGLYKISIGCQNCGYNKCSGYLDFHHVNPQTKSTRISCGIWKANTEVFQKELLKCILLCKNCHYEAHNRILIIEGNEGQWNCMYQN
jgi:hypothetical protein